MLVNRDAEHRIGALVVPREPLDDGLWGTCSHQHLVSALCNPLTAERPERIGGAASFGRSSTRRGLRSRPHSAPADAESKTAKYLTRLVGVEVSSVQSGDEADDLLWWKAPALDDNKVLPERLRQHVRERAFDIASC